MIIKEQGKEPITGAAEFTTEWSRTGMYALMRELGRVKSGLWFGHHAEIEILPDPVPEPDPVTVLAERLLNVARGCHDYNGGYRDREAEVFHHGISTVITSIEAAIKTPWGRQVSMLELFGRRASR